jgi:hypothetical protein
MESQTLFFAAKIAWQNPYFGEKIVWNILMFGETFVWKKHIACWRPGSFVWKLGEPLLALFGQPLWIVPRPPVRLDETLAEPFVEQRWRPPWSTASRGPTTRISSLLGDEQM